jgi:hypothetical protein
MNLITFFKTTKGRYYVLALFIYSIVIPVTIQHNFHGLAIDETAYYNISLKYRELHFREALNAYWSPLISWLMIPLTMIGAFAFSELMIIHFLCGYLLIYLTYKFSQRHQLDFWSEIIFLFSMLCLIIFFQLPMLWPDFLSATLFILFIFLITSCRLKTSSNFYLPASVGALLCAFAKSFFIFYILAHLLLLLAIAFFNKKNIPKLYIINIIRTLLIYVLGISIWAGLLSWKYDRFMINSSGTYNSNLMSPEGYLKHYSETSGLLPPPDQYSVNHWVDPTYYPISKRKIIENESSIRYQWGIIQYNLKIVYYMFSYFSYLKIAVLFFIILLFLLRNKINQYTIFVYFFSSMLVMAGYILVMIEERYLIGSQLLLYIAVFMAFYIFYKEKLSGFLQNKWVLSVSLILISISFLKNCPLQYISWRENKIDFEKTVPLEKEIAELSFLKGKRLTNGPFGKAISTLDYIAVRNNATVWGNTNKFTSENDQYLDLKNHAIDYYFYNNTHPFPSFLHNKKPSYTSKDGSVKIYSMKPYE